jgi:hypothetical protein
MPVSHRLRLCQNARWLGPLLSRIPDRLAAGRGLPQVIRTDNGKEFCGRAMLMWAHTCRVTLRLSAYSSEACHAFHVKAATQTGAKLPPVGA